MNLFATAVANPEVLIVAFVASDGLHVTDAVMFCVLLSEYVPVAVNCWVAPTAILGFAGVTAIEASVGLLPPPSPPPPPAAGNPATPSAKAYAQVERSGSG